MKPVGALALAALVAMVARGADAAPLDRVVGKTIRANYGALHGCFRKSLAQDRGRGGTLFITVTLGAADSVHSARVEKDGLGHKAASACVLTWVRGWTFRGAAAAGAGMRSEITIPITLRPAPKQFVVRLEDTAIAASGGVQRRALLTPKNSGATAATMEWIKIDRSSGAAPLSPAGAVDRVLYVLTGKGRYRVGRRTRRLAAGTVLWAGGGIAVTLQGELEWILVMAPNPRAASGQPVAVGLRGTRARVDGRVRAWPLLTHARIKHRRIYAGLVALARGQHELPMAGQAELLYLLEGAAEVILSDGTTQHVGPGHAIYLPPGMGRRIKVAAAMRALQIYAPAGPERRYFKTFKRGRPWR